MAAESRPWHYLRDHPEIEVARVWLPDGLNGVLAEADGCAVIMLNRDLLRPQRDATAWHELTHRTRGGSGWRPGLPANLQGLVDKEEARVDRIVAGLMVPEARLDELRGRPDPITIEEAADELEVPPDVLRRRLAG